MKHLILSEDLKLPIDAATQTFAFIARKGAGKTYAAGKMIEQMLHARVQVVILDTVGNWYGLRIKADGSGPAFDVPVFGGLRGDMPLEATAGELVADVVVDTGRSLILDVSQFSLGDRKRFAVSFGERLWRRKKGEAHPSPLHLVIEESQLIIPQFVKSGGDEARMVGIYEEIIRLGRNYGIGCTMISQRPQSVNKEVLNQTECLFVGQINGAQERDALKKWITHQGMDVRLIDELPSLPIGTMYVWSPQWLNILQRIKIGKKETLDASSTPKVGDRSVRRDPAPLDLAEIKGRMASIVESAKANDPKALKAEIARLKIEKQKLEQAKPAAAKVETKTVERAVLKDGQLNKLIDAAGKMQTLLERSGDLYQQMIELRDSIAIAVKRVSAPTPSALVRPSGELIAASLAAPRTPRPAALAPVKRIEGVGSPELGEKSGLRRILIAIAQRPGLTNRQIGIRAGLSASSGSFRTYLSRARSNGWIRDEGDRRFITDAGLAALGSYQPLPAGQELLAHWLKELGDSGASRILQSLANCYPAPMTKEEIAAEAGMSPDSGSFRTYMSRLRTLELIESRPGGFTTASAELFE